MLIFNATVNFKKLKATPVIPAKAWILVFSVRN